MKVTVQPEVLSEVGQAEILAHLIDENLGNMFVGTVEVLERETNGG